MKTKIKIAFRVFPEGDVIALFIDHPDDVLERYITSYMHLGQHGGASPDLVDGLEKATPEQYKDLLEELTGIYKDEELVVVQTEVACSTDV